MKPLTHKNRALEVINALWSANEIPEFCTATAHEVWELNCIIELFLPITRENIYLQIGVALSIKLQNIYIYIYTWTCLH